ncbi:hypothetical protein GHT06_019160 [Daphnia sinensis]|uniref:Peptidase M14 domain-containing protein n=1 Tax=Daphnia sinensis TaxID=1820382 RepID=A0AAD5PSU1_9CRUS|nr:hypothetical protein GHT06_019160 [Daphnia sinensis]
MDWDTYHELSDIYDFLIYLNATYPKLVQLTQIGTSYEKRPLYVIRISSSSSPGTRPAIWVDGGFHAREWISPAVATYIIQQLVEVPANAKLSSKVDWYIMPVVNPDGYEHSHTVDRLWRKTRSVTNDPECLGVDPNRNFGYKLYLTLHSYGQVALIPYGYDVVYAPDHNDLLALAKDAISKFVEYTYKVGNTGALGYIGAGGSDDWAKSIGIKYSYTFELPDTGIDGFLLPASDILPVCQDFFPALDVFAAKVATCCNAATTTVKPRTTATTRKTTATTRKVTTTKRPPMTVTSKRTTTKCPCVCG